MKQFRRRVPEVFQIEAAECGAASLCMILGYYGRYIDLTTMRKDCHISRDGSRMSYIMAAAEKHGMKADAYRADPELTGRKLPLIAFWNYSHFLVVEKLDKKWVYLVDPAYGRRRVTKEEFAHSFSGVVLELECTEDFEPCGKPYNPYNLVSRVIKARKGALIYLAALTLMIDIVGLIMPVFTILFVDYFLPYLKNAKLTGYFLAFFIVIILQASLLVIRRHVNLKFRRLYSADLTGRITRKLLRLPMGYFGTRNHSTIGMYLNDIDGLTDFVSSRLIPIMLDFIFSFVYIFLLFVYSLKVAVPTLMIIAILIAVIIWLLKASRSAIVLSATIQGEYYSSAVQNVRLFETIKSVAIEDESFLESVRKYSSWQNALMHAQKLLSVLQAIPVAVPLLIQVVVIAAGSSEVIRGRLAVGEVLACQSIAMSVFAPIVTMIAEFSAYLGQEVKIRTLEDIEREEEDIAFMSDAEESVNLDASGLKLENVSFGYNTALPPVIEDISVSVRQGGSVAFVGGSGSGKSTILKLIEGLYIPQKGSITFGETLQQKINRSALVDAIAVVSQEPYVFTGTIRENITLFDRSIDMESITLAAKAACVFDAIEAHPDGFNAMISPVDNSFSGGETQRIMIARALVRKPSVLILDEATSALDTVVEQQVMMNIRKMNITTLIVAHRLSAIRDCDEIIVLDKGRIVERGTHDELAAAKGMYRELMTSEENDE
ncbi:MAG: ATP-binding cassette domain-containing protein [Lachnospiraceae bacterium]|nr:ATP-binding cassette domain-containing protein [Lachnospiraceae bacterium]